MCFIIVSCYFYRSSLVLNPHQDPMLNGFVLPSLLVKNHRVRWLNTHCFSCKTRSCRRKSQPPAIQLQPSCSISPDSSMSQISNWSCCWPNGRWIAGELPRGKKTDLKKKKNVYRLPKWLTATIRKQLRNHHEKSENCSQSFTSLWCSPQAPCHHHASYRSYHRNQRAMLQSWTSS